MLTGRDALAFARIRALGAAGAGDEARELPSALRRGRSRRRPGRRARQRPLAARRAGSPRIRPAIDDAWHPYAARDPDRELDCSPDAEPGPRLPGARAQPLAPTAPARGERRGRRARKPRNSKRPRARRRRFGVRRATLPASWPGASPPRAAGTGPARRRPLRAEPRLPPRRAARPARGAGVDERCLACRADRTHAPVRLRACSGPTGHPRSSTTAGSTWRRGSSSTSRRQG